MNDIGIYAVISAAQGGLVWLLQNYYSGKIKQRFDDKTEILKSQLEKQNITHQANISKFVEYKFEKVNHLLTTLVKQYNKQFEVVPDGTVMTIPILKGMQQSAHSDFDIFKTVIDEAMPYISEELKRKLQIFASNIRAKFALEAQIDIDNMILIEFEQHPNVQSEGADYYENLDKTIKENVEKIKKVNITIQKSFSELSNSLIHVLNPTETK